MGLRDGLEGESDDGEFKPLRNGLLVGRLSVKPGESRPSATHK